MLGQSNTLNFTFLICWTSGWRHGMMIFDIVFINTITCSNLVQYIFIHSQAKLVLALKDDLKILVLYYEKLQWFDLLLASVLQLKHAIQFIFLKCYFNKCNDDSVWNYLLLVTDGRGWLCIRRLFLDPCYVMFWILKRGYTIYPI